ncbi:hypothetical protein SAMN04488030_2447 [Aliiroseovarius halocynthiae]|uniref:Uncharacterized protein n=1 Tax=Aliiroseovarius halocynthiae TaxID=985055 RepID=A0A545SQA9_9RHOB|nr:hypothetical protein [Aliiroseovarius halocynthiae]TQV67165.1 hypothetical protein FIL88_11320 [Aliiroseovarius halocynthiae]SMR82105.1 hypothetical protein SAMN04488030_2447 [Aliiroseovarius halocynthiae]
MKTFRTGIICVFVLPGLAQSEELPLYVNQDGELSFTGDMLSEAQIADLLGGQDVVDAFGQPVMIVKDAKSGATSASYISPEIYELAQTPMGDGVIENKHDGLIFEEHEGTDLREDLEFSEDEGTDVRHDLDVSEDEGADAGDDLTFIQAEALVVSKGFEGPADFYAQAGLKAHVPQDGTWVIHIDSSNAVGCPPGIAEVAASQVVHSGVTQIRFSAPHWRPADINSDYARFVWTPVGRNGYFAEPFSTGVDAAGSGLALSVTMALSASSDMQINIWSRVLLKLAPAMAAIAGGSETCTATITGRYVRS